MADTAMPAPEKCPKCHSALYGADGQPIVLGIIVPGVYSDVLFYECPFCAHRMHRFDMTSRLHWIAKDHMTPPWLQDDGSIAEG